MPRITDLPGASTLTGSESLPIVQVGTAKVATTTQLIALLATAVAGLTETRTTKTYPADGLTWTLNGGLPVLAVTRIYMNGILQSNSDFTINLTNGTVTAGSFGLLGSNRFDIFWID